MLKRVFKITYKKYGTKYHGWIHGLTGVYAGGKTVAELKRNLKAEANRKFKDIDKAIAEHSKPLHEDEMTL